MRKAAERGWGSSQERTLYILSRGSPFEDPIYRGSPFEVFRCSAEGKIATIFVTWWGTDCKLFIFIVDVSEYTYRYVCAKPHGFRCFLFVGWEKKISCAFDHIIFTPRQRMQIKIFTSRKKISFIGQSKVLTKDRKKFIMTLNTYTQGQVYTLFCNDSSFYSLTNCLF